MRRSEKEISDRSRLNDILDECRVCRIALHDDPYPYIVPVNFARFREQIYFHCASEGHKMDLLRQDPHVRFEVDRLLEIATDDDTACRWGAIYESVIGTGRARIVDKVAEKEAALNGLMQKYSGRGDWEFSPASLQSVAVVSIEIHGLTGKATTP